MAVKLPTFSGRLFKWNGRRGSVSMRNLAVCNYPARGFYIHSPKTNSVQLFLPDNEDMKANEFYDGEAYTYFAPGGDIRVTIQGN